MASGPLAAAIAAMKSGKRPPKKDRLRDIAKELREALKNDSDDKLEEALSSFLEVHGAPESED